MQTAHNITIRHTDDSVTEYTDAAYQHSRDGVTVMTEQGVATHDDVVDFQAYKRRPGE